MVPHTLPGVQRGGRGVQPRTSFSALQPCSHAVTLAMGQSSVTSCKTMNAECVASQAVH